MRSPGRPPDEDARLAALRSYDILDSEPEPAFDRLTRLGARLFAAPISLVSLIDQDRQWFKSCYGMTPFESSRHESFCAHAINAKRPLVILDAAADERFADNPLVTGGPQIRFYAGAPIISPQGHALGTVCIIDSAPRSVFSLEDQNLLQDLAALASEELELRRSVHRLKGLERSLRTSENRFHWFMRYSPAIALIKEEGGRLLYVNEAAERVWKVRATDWLGKMPGDIWPAAIAERMHETERAVLEGGSPQSSEEEIPGPEGISHHLLSLKFPFEDGPEKRLLGVMAIDITEQKRLEEQLRQLNMDLSEQTRLAQEASRLKSQFLANMSHELRTPLNGIIGFTELLADGRAGELNTRQQRFMENVLLSSQHLLHLINDLLDLAKIEAGKLEFHPQTVSAKSLIEEVVSSQQAISEAKHIAVTCVTDLAMDELFTDPVRFKQVVHNFLSNAVKFTPEHGQVQIRTAAHKPGLFRVDVTDTGIGITQEDLGRLFQDFEQLDNGPAKKFGGSGLGLALVKKLVVAQGGFVECQSCPQKGSTFSAILPQETISARTSFDQVR